MANLPGPMSTIDQLIGDAEALVSGAATLEQLDEVESQLVGRRSELAELRRTLGARPADERRALGAEINQAQRRLEELLAVRRGELEKEAEDRLLASDKVDITLPAVGLVRGTHHLITQSMAETCEIFRAIGYQVVTGPEVETVHHNFDALNHTPHHPARLPSDTLYVEPWDGRSTTGPDALLLRTHTSPMQARVMERQQPPVYVVVPGRTYRPDPWDATHAPVFHQVEGLAVAEDITFGDLKGTLEHFAREMFGPTVKTRFTPDFFPFTEPSAQMAVSWRDDWLELLGCGMVDPNVFEAVGYDPSRVSGFAFGLGADRVAMVRHGIDDIRLLYENDLRVLRQFR
jgi:phenylalanyl-tRNA synthetase alpha chain